jgi:hypothetical protein
MNMTKFLTLLTCLQIHNTYATEYVPHCPETINVMQKLTQTPEGWTATSKGDGNGKTSLKQISFSEGDPVNLVILAPNSSKKNHHLDTETWLFTTPSKEGYWASCEYTNTNIVLTQKIPDNIKSCSIIYVTPTWTIRHISCQ